MRVCIRVNADRQTGLGHIYRCRHLARFLRRRGCDVVFISNAESVLTDWPVTMNRHDVGGALEVEATKRLIVEAKPDVLIVDLFAEECRAPRNYVSSVGFARKSLCFVDSADGFQPCGSVTINPNPTCARNGDAPDYLRGLEYMIINPALRMRPQCPVAQASRLCRHRRDGGATKVLGRTQSKSETAERSVFISLGSVDEEQMLPEILKVLSQSGEAWRVDVLVSRYARYHDRLGDMAGAMTRLDIGLHCAVSDGELCELMNRARVCITNGGNVTFELMYLRKKIVVLPSNDRLMRLAAWCEDRGAVVVCRDPRELRRKIGCSLDTSPPALIDGRGVARIADVVLN